MSEPTPRDPLAVESPSRNGTFFVVASGVFLVTFLVFILVVSPRLQDQLGLTEGAVDFPTPSVRTEVPLTAEGDEVGKAIWDAGGVCAEVIDSAGSIFRTCAEPDVLRGIWGIDAPDEATPAYVIVAAPPEAATVTITTTDGDEVEVATQARDLPAAWAIAPLPTGAVVAEVATFDDDGADMSVGECGVEDAPEGGPRRLAGGCLVPRED
ncbi:hypothetical protein [Euzebya sp.]|uniref:hypothetical protein n=1 Tax=Euzebya sp. TaxID=1971409 RepID=UPI0035112B5F